MSAAQGKGHRAAQGAPLPVQPPPWRSPLGWPAPGPVRLGGTAAGAAAGGCQGRPMSPSEEQGRASTRTGGRRLVCRTSASSVAMRLLARARAWVATLTRSTRRSTDMGDGADAEASPAASAPVTPPSGAFLTTTAGERRARPPGGGAPARRARTVLPAGTGRAPGRQGLLPRGARGASTGMAPVAHGREARIPRSARG